MRTLNHKYLVYTIGLFVLASVAGLWSWNTLAELFSLPQAQYKHVLAALFPILILRWLLLPRQVRIHRLSGDVYECQTH